MIVLRMWGQEGHGMSLYLPLNFAMNLKKTHYYGLNKEQAIYMQKDVHGGKHVGKKYFHVRVQSAKGQE
jgi:hypothetical protein